MLEGREIPLLEDERLAEMGFGCLEGYYCKGEKMNIPDPKFHYFYDDPACYQAPEGGESFEELLKRAKGFLADLCEKKHMKIRRFCYPRMAQCSGTFRYGERNRGRAVLGQWCSEKLCGICDRN